MIYNGIKWYNSKGYWRNNTYGLLHRYIYTQHNGTIPEGYVVHHDNEDKLDNSPKNLIAMTRGEHQKLHNLGNTYTLGKKHSEETKLKIGLGSKGNKYNLGKKRSEETKQKISESHQGEKHPQAKLTTIDVIAIKTWILLGYTNTAIGKVFGVSQTHISKIKTGKKWSHIEVR